MKIGRKSLINYGSIVCFGALLFLLSKFTLQGFGSINHLNIPFFPTLLVGLEGGKFLSIIVFAIFLSFFISSKISFYLVVFPIIILAAFYSPIAAVYGAPDYQSAVSLLSTNFSEASEYLSMIPLKEYGKSVLIVVLAFLSYWTGKTAKIQPWKNKFYVLMSCAFFGYRT